MVKAMLKGRLENPPPDWDAWDKILVAELIDTRELRMTEFDVKTRFLGQESIYEIDAPSKMLDIFLVALLGHISPVAKMERAMTETATFQIKGADIAAALRPSDLGTVNDLAGVDVNRSVLTAFVRSRDRNGKLIGVSPVPWTVLVPEKIDPITHRLHCRVESPLRSSLTSRRRGQTEIYALSVPTPMLPTTLKLQPRKEGKAVALATLPIYEVFEVPPGGQSPISIGHTRTDGVFVLEPHEKRPYRMILFRSGRTLVAQIPVIRGLKAEQPVPIPDDSVRLEAEGVVLGIQEEMVDMAARRSILQKRLEKFQKEKNEAMVRETEGQMNRLKDRDRFLIELDQARLRFHSDDPVVQRRIDKLFRDTRRALQPR